MSVTYAAGLGVNLNSPAYSTPSMSASEMVKTTSASGGICSTGKSNRGFHRHSVFNNHRVHQVNQPYGHTYLKKNSDTESYPASIDKGPVPNNERMISYNRSRYPLLIELLENDDIDHNQWLRSNSFNRTASVALCNKAVLTPAVSTVAHTENSRTGIMASGPDGCRNRGVKRADGSHDHSDSDSQLLSARVDKKKCDNPLADAVLEDPDVKAQFNVCLEKKHQALIAGMTLQAVVHKQRKGDGYTAVRFTSPDEKEIEIDCSNTDRVIECLGGRDSMYKMLNEEAEVDSYDAVNYKDERKKIIVVKMKGSQKAYPVIINSAEDPEIEKHYIDWLGKQHQLLIEQLYVQVMIDEKSKPDNRFRFTPETKNKIEIDVDCSNKDWVTEQLGGGASLWQLLSEAAKEGIYDCIKYNKTEGAKTIKVNLEQAKALPSLFSVPT